MTKKVMEKIDNCDSKTLHRISIIIDIKVFDKDVDDYVKYENRKTIRNQGLNFDFKKYAILNIA